MLTLALLFRMGFGTTKAHLIGSQDVRVLEGLFTINQSNATLLFHGMLSLSIQTWTCAGAGESPSSAIRIPWFQVKLAADILSAWSKLPSVSFFKIQTRLGCGAGFVQVFRADFDLSLSPNPTSLGSPQSPPILLSFLRIHPTLSAFSAIIPVEIFICSPYNWSSFLSCAHTPCLIPLLCILHKKCPKCYFLKWIYDHVPPLKCSLAPYWLMC